MVRKISWKVNKVESKIGNLPIAEPVKRFWSMINRRFKIDKVNALYLILICFGLIITLISFTNHYFFRTYSYDYAAYNFAFYDYAHLRISPNPIYWAENMSFLQDHLSYLFFLFIPLYWILTPIFGTYTLLFIQNAFILLGGWAVYKLLKYKTDNQTISVFGLLLYFLTYGRYSAFTADVNLAVILASMVPVYLYFFEKRNFLAAFIFLGIILTGRENMPIWLSFVILVQIIWNKRDRIAVRWAVIFLLFSITYFFIAYYILIPYVENGTHHFSLFNYSVLGKDPLEALIYLISHPWQSVKLLFVNHTGVAEFDGLKMEFYYVYFISGAFILLYRPYYFLFFIPIVMQKMYNDGQERWGIDTYYSIEVVTLLPIAVFLTINEFKNTKLRSYLSWLVIMLAVVMTIHKSDLSNRVLKWYNSDKYKFYDPAMYRADFNASVMHDMLNSIPKDASVSASDNIAPHLAFRDTVYYYPRVEKAEFIAIKINKVSPYFTPEQYFKLFNDKLFSGEWSVFAYEYPLLIIRHRKPVEKKQSLNFLISNLGENYSLIERSVDTTISLLAGNKPIGLECDEPVHSSDRIRIECTVHNYEDNFQIMSGETSDVYFTGKYIDSLPDKETVHLVLDITLNKEMTQKKFTMNIVPSGKNEVQINQLKIKHFAHMLP